METCVYVVDDDQLVRESLEWLLESVNIQTQLYENGQAFLDAFQPNLPGCVVLDVRMPGINGMDLHHTIKQLDPNLPVIIVTGHADVPHGDSRHERRCLRFYRKTLQRPAHARTHQLALHQYDDLQKNQERQQALDELFSNLSKREEQVMQGVLKGRPQQTHCR